jgi:hypothetical protein
VVIDNVVQSAGGKGGDSGIKGNQGTAGGGGGGIAGGGGTYNGQGGESALAGRPCDGGDVKLTVESDMPSVSTSNTFQLTGGTKGDGKTSQGGGGTSGGTGKGRTTRDGMVNMFIPMSIPHPLEPAENALLEGDVTFRWSIAHPAWDGNRERQVQKFYLQIDNNSNFKSPDADEDNIDATVDFYTVAKNKLIGGIVYWRIKAIYEIGVTDWSEVKTFKHNIEPELIKEIPAIKLDEDTDAMNKIDLNNHFTDDLWPTKLNYTIISQEYPEQVLVSIADDHFLSIETVEEDWFGTSQVQIKAEDKRTLTNVSNKFSITVVPVNDAPVITDIPDQIVTEDQEFILDLTPYVADVDNNVTQLTASSDSTYVAANGLSLQMLYSVGAMGGETVTVTVSDLRLNAYTSFNVSISPVNDAPTIKRIPDRTMEEDSPLSFSLIPYAKDEEDLPTDLTWSAVGGQLVSASVDAEGTLTLTSLTDQSGNDEITLTVTDRNGLPATTTVTVVVLPVNDPPIVAPIEDDTNHVGTPYEKNLETYITDVDNLMSELILTSDSLYVTSIVGFTVTLEYPLDTTIDIDEITFSVSDGVDIGSAKMQLTLMKPPRFVNEILDMVLLQGETKTLDLSIFATDDIDDQSELKWSVTGKGDKGLITATVKGSSTLSIKAGTAKTGATTIKVTVMDSDDFTATQDVRITVKESAAGGTIGATSENLMIPFLLIIVLVTMVGMTIGYKYKLRRDRIGRIKLAQEARMRRKEGAGLTKDGVSLTGTSLTHEDDKLEAAATGPSAVQLAMMHRAAPLCFACGAKTRPDERGRFICPKCGRMST